MGQKRSAMTHVALLCDDEEIQPLLPQYIFVNVAHISPENLANVQHLLMPNMIVSRVKNSWMTVDKMKVVFKGLADTLRKHRVRRQVVFSADAYRAHLSPAVWQSAGAHGFFYFMIPAKLTWCLQPCDTGLFARFKQKLAVSYQSLLIARGLSSGSTALVLEALSMTIDTVMHRTEWRPEFEKLGLRGKQSCLSSRVLSKLGLLVRPPSTAAMPTLLQFQNCFPRRSVIPFGHMFGAVIRASLASRGGSSDASICVAMPAAASSRSAIPPFPLPPLPPPPCPPRTSGRNLPQPLLAPAAPGPRLPVPRLASLPPHPAAMARRRASEARLEEH